MKRFYLSFLFIFLFPILTFAEADVTISHSDTQLQSRPAVILKTSYFSILLPAYLKIDTVPPAYDMIAVEGNSPDGELKISILATEKVGAYEMLSRGIKNNNMLTNKQIQIVTLSGFTGIKVSGLVDMINKSYQQITYVLSNNDKTVSITACINPEKYESYLPLIAEITSTLQIDSTKLATIEGKPSNRL